MIIKQPTGLWGSVLPQTPSDSTSVIYTISSVDPPRSNLLFLQLPSGIERAAKSDKEFDEILQRRPGLGDLNAIATETFQSQESTNRRRFKIGEVLEFTSAAEQDIAPLLVGLKTNTFHDTYRIDQDRTGSISASVSAAAAETYEKLSNEINSLRSTYNSLKSKIAELQKTINEQTRVIVGLETIISNMGGTDIGTGSDIDNALESISESRANNQQELSDTIVLLNKMPASIQEKRDELESLAVLIT